MIRDAGADDLSWIVHSWLHSFADSDAALLVTPRDEAHARRCETCGAWRIAHDGYGRPYPGAEYYRGQRALVLALLRRSKTIVEESSEGLLDGFLCSALHQTAEGYPIVHYVYVRLSARERGVARALLSTLGQARRILYTHRSRRLEQRRLPPGFVYDPYQLYWSLAA